MASTQVWCQVTVRGADGSVLCAWTMRGSGEPDLAAVDLLARLYLASSRRGGSVALSDVVVPLDELLELAGLSRLRGKVGGQAEGGEQPVGLEEGVEPADPPV
jgi:hypothetical protein